MNGDEIGGLLSGFTADQIRRLRENQVGENCSSYGDAVCEIMARVSDEQVSRTRATLDEVSANQSLRLRDARFARQTYAPREASSYRAAKRNAARAR